MNTLLAAPKTDSAPLWAVFVVAAIPAMAAIVAAVLAGRSAARAHAAEAERDRLQRLDARVSERKYDVYAPMLNLLRDMLDPTKAEALDQDQTVSALRDFAAWIGVYGSDDAVRAYHNFMQGTYQDAPPAILLRLYADFAIEVRRDLGDPDTRVNPVIFMGIRINDLYTGEAELMNMLSKPFDEACAEAGWAIPWSVAPHRD